jgi:hypothetical protein
MKADSEIRDAGALAFLLLQPKEKGVAFGLKASQLVEVWVIALSNDIAVTNLDGGLVLNGLLNVLGTLLE